MREPYRPRGPARGRGARGGFQRIDAKNYGPPSEKPPFPSRSGEDHGARGQREDRNNERGRDDDGKPARNDYRRGRGREPNGRYDGPGPRGPPRGEGEQGEDGTGNTPPRFRDRPRGGGIRGRGRARGRGEGLRGTYKRQSKENFLKNLDFYFQKILVHHRFLYVFNSVHK